MSELPAVAQVYFPSYLLEPSHDALSSSTRSLISDQDVMALRRLVREMAVVIQLSLVDQTKLVIATSELARNTIKYGGGGEVHLVELDTGLSRGVKVIFVDNGPGISNPTLALIDGYSTGGGLGLGLAGARRLADEFHIDTRIGEGTVVSIIKWTR